MDLFILVGVYRAAWWFIPVNPLTPELNTSAQRCLTRYFTVDFAS
jgi:predicted GNAT superfamily acetyltransferase